MRVISAIAAGQWLESEALLEHLLVQGCVSGEVRFGITPLTNSPSRFRLYVLRALLGLHLKSPHGDLKCRSSWKLFLEAFAAGLSWER